MFASIKATPEVCFTLSYNWPTELNVELQLSYVHQRDEQASLSIAAFGVTLLCAKVTWADGLSNFHFHKNASPTNVDIWGPV